VVAKVLEKQLLYFQHEDGCKIPPFSVPKMETVCLSETSRSTYLSARCQNQGERYPHHSKNLKSHTTIITFISSPECILSYLHENFASSRWDTAVLTHMTNDTVCFLYWLQPVILLLDHRTVRRLLL
jgi:hypothetical protein